MALGVSMVRGKFPARYAWAFSSSRRLTRSRRRRPTSPTISRNASTVASVRVSVFPMKSPP